MKILKEGNPIRIHDYRVAKKEIFKLTCDRCGCQFEFDIMADKYEQDQREASRWCKCPYCKNKVDF